MIFLAYGSLGKKKSKSSIRYSFRMPSFNLSGFGDAGFWFICFLYMFMVYSVVTVFTISSVGVHVYAMDTNYDLNQDLPNDIVDSNDVMQKKGSDMVAKEHIYIPIVEEVGSFLSYISKFVGYIQSYLVFVFNFLSFNIVNPVGLPVFLSWIPFLMVFPVQIAVTVRILPLVVDLLKAFMSALDAVIPF